MCVLFSCVDTGVWVSVSVCRGEVDEETIKSWKCELQLHFRLIMNDASKMRAHTSKCFIYFTHYISISNVTMYAENSVWWEWTVTVNFNVASDTGGSSILKSQTRRRRRRRRNAQTVCHTNWLSNQSIYTTVSKHRKLILWTNSTVHR